METTCSLAECRKQLVGVAVMLQDVDETFPFEQGGFAVYHGEGEAGPTAWVLLHPVCFENLVREIVKKELQATFWTGIVNVGVLKDALAN